MFEKVWIALSVKVKIKEVLPKSLGLMQPERAA